MVRVVVRAGCVYVYRFSTTGATLIGLDRSRVRSKHPRHFGAEYTYCSPQIYPLAKHALCFERIRSCFLLVDEAFLPRRRHQELPGSSKRSSEVGGPSSAVWVRFACARSRRSSSVAGLPRFLPRWERTLSLRISALCCKLQVRSSSAPFHAGALVSTGVGGRLGAPTGTRMAWSSSVWTCDTPVQSADAPVLCASWVPCCAYGAKCSLNVVVFGNLATFYPPLGHAVTR
jgi:hypothetical protein